MTTANEIIKAAFRISGVTTKGESPDADETQDALASLSDLIESLSNDSLFVYATDTESFPLSGGVNTYTIGSGGDFDTVRPIDINAAYVRQGTTDYPVQNITDEQYAAITQKSTQSRPYYLNYSADFPLGSIKLYPTPSGGYTLFLVSEKPLDTLTLNQTLSMPPGWARFLKNQLAIEICAEYGVDIPPTAIKNASEAMGLIKRATAKVKSMDANPIPMNNRNIYTGWYD